MLLVISPAKKLDFSPVEIENNLSKPLFQKDATNLANVAAKLSKLELKQLMSISDNLADLNFQRFQSFKNNPTEISTKAAAFAFNGDTYTGLNIMEFSKLDLDFLVWPLPNSFSILSFTFSQMGKSMISPHGLLSKSSWRSSQLSISIATRVSSGKNLIKESSFCATNTDNALRTETSWTKNFLFIS